MTFRRPRVPAVLAIVGVVATYLLFIVAERLARQQLADSITDPALLEAATNRLIGQFSLVGIFAMIATALLGWTVGRMIMQPFDRLTAELAGSRTIIPQSRLAEPYALALAASRRDSEALGRTVALETTAAQLGRLVDAVSEGLIHLDQHGRVLQANPAAIRFLGMPPVVEQKYIVMLSRNVDVRHLVQRAIDGELLDAVEITVDERHLLVNARPLPADGLSAQGAGSVLSITDLTDLRRLESVRRDFVANVSHELKTPLTSIHGYAETLRSDEDMPVETRRQFLEVIDRNAVRLQHIVDELLDLSRIESGAWRPEIRDVDVAEIARDVWTTCRDMSRAREIEFTAPAPAVMVRADVEGLRTILSNVIGNAVRYTPAGGRITVTVRDAIPTLGAGPAHMRILDVTDTGAGIPRDAVRRIFERFYRVDPARSREAGGTGLGLAIVKHIAEAMDGTVSASSELGRGTTISISLPAA